MKKKKEKIIIVVALIALALVTFGVSYAAFRYIGQGQRENTIQTGNLTFVYDEPTTNENGISIENVTPTSDELGSVSRAQGAVFEFSVTASTKGAPIYYEIYTTKQDSSTLPEEVVKTYLTNVQGEEETGIPNTLTNEAINTYSKLGISQVPDQEGGRTLCQEMIPVGLANYTKIFRYRMWLSDTATEVNENGEWIYNNKSFTVRVNVYASSAPILIPILPYEFAYQITSSDLDDNNQITVAAGKTKSIDIMVTSLNEIESHFKLYYLGGENEEVIVSYAPNDIYPDGLGTLAAQESTPFAITIENKTTSDVTITLGIQGGLKDKELVLMQGKELMEIDACGPNPNAPVLVQGQIPVVYDKKKSSWVKADITSEWYNYCNQEWANAVTVTSSKRNTYTNASAGTPISMNDINTMWVWIPRYEYMYTNLGTKYAGGTKAQPGEIKIDFLNGTSTTPSDSANYKVHPAFTFGTDELEGLWYGKFETATADSSCNLNPKAANCNKLMTSLQIIPNISSWRYSKISNFFTSIRNMQLQYASTYGFSKTDSDIHMSKNTEWGAVAYLSQSKYGKYGNPDYTGANKEIYQNKSKTYITGMSNGTPSTRTFNTQVTYNVEKSGTGASTTGNITGVYDMSGGAWEYVMGYLTTASSTWGAASGGNHASFTSKPEDKYFDAYTTESVTTACGGRICYGHALNETNGWYNDIGSFAFLSIPWAVRSSYYGDDTIAGIFYFNYYSGNSNSSYASRSVIVPVGA